MEVNAPASGKGSGWKGPGWKAHQVELSTLTIRVEKKHEKKRKGGKETSTGEKEINKGGKETVKGGKETCTH